MGNRPTSRDSHLSHALHPHRQSRPRQQTHPLSFGEQPRDAIPRPLLDPRVESPELASLPHKQHVPARFLFPYHRPSTREFQGDPEDASVFMKAQAFLAKTAYCSEHFAACTAQEIARCSHIARTPHANLARYLGVETRIICGEERVTRLAYQRYGMDLHTFVLQDKLLRHHHVGFLMQEIEKGVKHLHGMGLVHCDLRPMNVFATVEDERDADGIVVLKQVVVGDFDANVRVGEEVALERASAGWWPDDATWGTKADVWIDE